MNIYVDWLKLDFDPFLPGAARGDFYCSGHRQQLLDQIVEFSLYSNAMIAVTGPLGAGKTTLAANFCDRFAEEAVCVKVASTLFMNQGQFLEALQAGLPFKTSVAKDVESAISQISQYAAELDLEARSLILIIDDAHELGAEVLQLLTTLLESSVDSSIHALLFGENQLDNLLQSTLTAEAQERLAVFPLEGFASDETHEYIRFKLVAAGYSKDLPIGAGVVGAIHNSAQGMPGSINSLTIDALNSAAPGSEPIHVVEDEDFGPLFGGERIEQPDNLDEFEGDDSEGEIPAQAWIGGIQLRYWASAAALVVLLTGTLLFWDTTEQMSEPAPIPVAATPAEPPAQPVPVPAPEIAAVTTSQLAVALVESVQPIPVTSAPIAEVEQVEEVIAEVVVPEPPAEIAAQVEEPAAPAETMVLAEASSFEERLLRASPQNYAVQLLASHSESNIQGFLEQFGSDQPAGYFETRHQGRPWFVALLAAFDDRAQASEAIAALPAELRSNQPWIRSVAGIQTDIRELMSSKLVSSQ